MSKKLRYVGYFMFGVGFSYVTGSIAKTVDFGIPYTYAAGIALGVSLIAVYSIISQIEKRRGS